MDRSERDYKEMEKYFQKFQLFENKQSDFYLELTDIC